MTDERAGLRSIMRNAAFLGGSGIYGTLIRAGYVFVVARGLGPEGYGILSSLQGLYLIFVFVVTSGLPHYLSREAAGGAGTLAARQSLAVTLAVLALGAGLFLLIGVAAEPVASLTGLYPVFAVAILARGLAFWARHLFLAREASQYHLVQTLIFTTVELVLVAIALSFGAGIWAVSLIHTGTWLADSAASLLLLRNRFGPVARPRLDDLGRAAPAILTVGLAFAAANWLRMTPLVAYRYGAADPAEAGRFALAWNAAMILAMLVVTMMNAAAPVISRARARADGKEALYLRAVLQGAPLAGGAGFILGLGLADWLLRLVGGAAYGGAGIALSLLLAIIGPLSANHAMDQALYLEGRTRTVFTTNAGAALLIAAIAYALAPVTSLAGVAAALLASLTALAVLKAVLADHTLGHHVSGVFARSLAAAALAGGAAWWLLPSGASFAVALGLIALPVLALGLRVVKQDRQITE